MGKKLTILLGFVLFFLVLFYFFRIDNFPFIRGDESWVTQSSYSLATAGHFGSPMFKGFFNAENVTHTNPPLYYLCLAGVFKVFGVGVLQGRSLSIFFSFLSIFVFIKIIKYQFSKLDISTILLSIIVILSSPIFYIFSKTIRPEALIFFLSLLTYYFLIRGISERKMHFIFLSGITSSLALLANISGTFIFIYAFLLILLENYRYLFFYLTGFSLPSFCYFLWIIQDFRAFYGPVVISRGGEVASVSDKIKGFFIFLLNKSKVALYLVYLSMIIVFSKILILRKIDSHYFKYYLLPIISFLVLMFFFPHYNALYFSLMIPFIALNFVYIYHKTKYKNRVLIITFSLVIINFIGLGAYYYKYSSFNYEKYISRLVKNIPKGATILGPTSCYIGLANMPYIYRSFNNPILTVNSKDKLIKVINIIKPDYIVVDNYDVMSNKDALWQKFYLDNAIKYDNFISFDYGSEGNYKNNPILIYKIVK